MPNDSLIPADEGIDRKLLRTARQRFLQISAARLERVRAVLPEKHRQFLDVLPLLLHINHPSLPGYVAQQTPCGISGYIPATAVVELARRLWRSFSPPRAAQGETGIDGIYLIGSTGTIGQSDSSDADFWICYPEETSSEALGLLQRKATLIGQWAMSIGLEAHLFLMNGDKFKRGQREPLTGENCGSAQHYILLDEFYRTGILLSGRVPLWWLIPPQADTDYSGCAQRITQQRYVKASELVDFGGIPGIPAGEFLGAGVWQLYKAIDSPYKSVLKLLLVEVYAARFPNTTCLSADYKQAVYHGITDIDELDPYVMIYRRLETHLQSEPNRLEIVRRCLYYKGGKALSKPPASGVKSWQRKLMERLVAEWGWSEDKQRLLDSRANWHIQEAAAERNDLVKELNYSYRFLTEFARRSEVDALIDAREHSILGRKLLAAFERKVGKVDVLNSDQAPVAAEGDLSFCALRLGAGDQAPINWGIYPEIVPPRGIPTKVPIRQAACLSELIAWCVLNGVLDERSNLAVREVTDGLRLQELDGMVRELRHHIIESVHSRIPSDEDFAQAARPLGIMMFVNVSADPQQEMREQGLLRISSRTDALGYSSYRENLVLNLETIVCTSWGEVLTTRYEGQDGLIRCIRDHIQRAPDAAEAVVPALKVRSFCASRPVAIVQRVQELFEDLSRCFLQEHASRNARYILEIADRFHIIQRRAGIAAAHTVLKETDLLHTLSLPQSEWSALVIDRHALRDSPLTAVAGHLRANSLSVFFETRPDTLFLIIVDEYGSVFQTEYATDREGSALYALDQFLSSVRFRRNGAPLPQTSLVDRAHMPRYFRLARASRGGSYQARAVESPLRPRGGTFLNVQAIMERSDTAQSQYTVYCDGISFCQRELGTDFHDRLAEHILTLRRSRESYPVYLTDLDVSGHGLDATMPIQTIHYLQHKAQLEAEINRCLTRNSKPAGLDSTVG